MPGVALLFLLRKNEIFYVKKDGDIELEIGPCNLQFTGSNISFYVPGGSAHILNERYVVANIADLVRIQSLGQVLDGLFSVFSTSNNF